MGLPRRFAPRNDYFSESFTIIVAAGFSLRPKREFFFHNRKKDELMGNESSFTVRDLPRQERPRERVQKFGPEALSAQELLALVIGRGIPRKSVMNIVQELLAKFGNIKAISQATIEELSQIKGIGLVKAAQIKACFELGKREDLEPELKNFDIKDPEAVVKAIRASIKDKAKEHFKLILLNPRNKMIGISTISIGTLNASLVHS